MVYRTITSDDVPTLFDVRVATRENAYTLNELTALGITPTSVREKLRSTCAGWLCEVGGTVVGFSMADRNTGEMWVIAVLPAYEEQGIGARLITMAEEWLWSCGCAEAWLTTDIDPTLRAYGFYRKQGWVDDGIRGNLRYMKKRKPALAAS